jgi:hypothetical protein
LGHTKAVYLDAVLKAAAAVYKQSLSVLEVIVESREWVVTRPRTRLQVSSNVAQVHVDVTANVSVAKSSRHSFGWHERTHVADHCASSLERVAFWGWMSRVA